MSSCSPEHWSLTRSLAFLAATFAIVFGSLFPAAVSAAVATGSPILMCAGDQIIVVYDEDGTPLRQSPKPMDGRTCGGCLRVSTDTVGPPPPPVLSAVPRRRSAEQLMRIRGTVPPSLFRFGLPPPSTAPPLAWV